MKKVISIVIIIGLTISVSKLAGDHFRYDLYHWAVDFETTKAGLVNKTAEINGQQYFYLERNNPTATETVLLLHGFSADKTNWLRFVQALPDSYRVLALDLMGHGEHPVDLNTNYSIENQLTYVQRFITQHVQGPIHIIGNSMGGAIASLYAATSPDKVKSLMLISPAGVHNIASEMDKLLADNTNPLIADSVEQFYQVVDFVMEDGPFIPAPVLKVQAEKAVERFALNQKIFTDIREDMNKNLDTRFSKIQAPTLILWGQEDRVINSENIVRYAELIPNASARLLEGIGHLAMLEVPEISAQAFVQLSSRTINSQTSKQSD